MRSEILQQEKDKITKQRRLIVVPIIKKTINLPSSGGVYLLSRLHLNSSRIHQWNGIPVEKATSFRSVQNHGPKHQPGKNLLEILIKYHYATTRNKFVWILKCINHLHFFFQTNTVNFLQRHIFGPESRIKNAISGCANNNEPEVEEEKEEFVREHDLTNDEINSVLDVLDVNAFEIRGNDFSIRGKNNSFIGLVLTLSIRMVCPKISIWVVF